MDALTADPIPSLPAGDAKRAAAPRHTWTADAVCHALERGRNALHRAVDVGTCDLHRSVDHGHRMVDRLLFAVIDIGARAPRPIRERPRFTLLMALSAGIVRGVLLSPR